MVITKFKRRVLLLASYCGDTNSDCTNALPCKDCLLMCNIIEMDGLVTSNHGGYDYNRKLHDFPEKAHER